MYDKIFKTFSINAYKEFSEIEKDIADLMYILDGSGIDIFVEKSSDYDDIFLHIDVDKDKFHKIKTRNAGPGYKVIGKRISSYKIKPTYREILTMQKIMSNKEIIAEIGCSESAFYRQMRYWKKKEKDSEFFDENVSFF